MPSKRFYRQKANEYQQIAKERIGMLFLMAKEEFANKREDLANRYVFLARRLAMKAKTHIPDKCKFSFCKKCLAYLVLGKNANVKTNPKTKSVELECKKCGFVRRFGYAKRS